MERLLPTKITDHWDYASVASLTRNILECYLIFFYFCIDSVSYTEWECRYNIFNLHDCTRRKKLFESEILGDCDQDIQGFNKQISELKDRLINNEYFNNNLSDKQKKDYLKGNKHLLLSQDEVIEKMGLSLDNFRFSYIFLSNQIHTLPMNFYRMGEQIRGTGVHSDVEEDYTQMCVDITIKYLEKAINDMENLFG
ncbi:hypothetical protein CY0110_11132 [Crocosphaera chwakensis CCY0110]|uniref:Uncharacterized protein n=2 Tax=Crocosphaera TaxID=263510 RepID=A3IV09_9CHRO|nr:hypothetical protein CY0110_11132 [Crocosphaera chwakensis CCY0110]